MKIAIVEDNRTESEIVLSYIARFEKENGIKIGSTVFCDGLAFLDKYNSDFDAVFMDIEMPHLNGMETSERLRKINVNIPLIFITNMKQFAINGYSVGASDFILKPVNYYRIESILKKLLRSTEKNAGQEKVIRTNGGLKILKLSQIYYVEIRGHELLYHTDTGDVEAYGTLKEIEKEFGESFVKCNNCYLINLKYVIAVDKNEIIVGQYKIEISQRKRKNFLDKLLEYRGRG